MPFATQLTCHFLWEVVFEDAIPQCCVLSQPGNRFFPAAALAPTTLQHLQNALITWLLVPLPTPTRQRAPRRPGSCLIPRGIMCWARGLTHSRAKEILLNGWTNGQKKMEFFLFSCHGVNSHFVVFWEYFQRVSKSYCVSDCNKAMCSGLWPNLLPARGWGSPLSRAWGRREGQAACPGACPVVQNPRRKCHGRNLRTLTQFYPLLPGLGSWLASSSFFLQNKKTVLSSQEGRDPSWRQRGGRGRKSPSGGKTPAQIPEGLLSQGLLSPASLRFETRVCEGYQVTSSQEYSL